MKSKQEIELLVQKFTLNKCTKEEIDELISFFQDKNSSNDFPDVEKLLPHLAGSSEMKQDTADRIFKHILYTRKKQQVQHKKVRKFPWKALAAVFVFGLMINGFIDQTTGNSGENTLILNDEEITLQLANGQIEILKQEETAVTNTEGEVIAVNKGNQLVYNSNDTNNRELEYNTITVPYGKKFELSLGDGTRVHLNAGTSLKYPSKFVEGEKRQVYLTGEAFFDVARDETRPFIVNVEEVKVQVLGTSFNVSAYPEDINTEVVLVEGSVGMYLEGESFDESENKALEPGDLGSYHKQQKTFSEKKVLTSAYTSWVEGELVFRNMAFENILKKLERHYNISIINHRTELNQVAFNANFGEEPIEKVLDYFSRIYEIHYTIEDNQVFIK